MDVDVGSVSALRFDDGSPVRAASAIAAFGGGWLIVQDDATHAAWWRPESVSAVRVVDAVEGFEVFSAAAGTKHLKPDFEAAVAVGDDVLLLGSGSSPARMRHSLVRPSGHVVTELSGAYAELAAVLDLEPAGLNLEGACPVGDRLRWFQRANAAAGVPTVCADVGLAALLDGRLEVDAVRGYDLGVVDGVALAVTDAVALPDGRVLVSAAAEDTPNAIDDGPVVASALALLDDHRVLATAPIPDGPAGAYKVEGLAVREVTGSGVRLLAVTDADDALAPAERLELTLHW